MRIDVVGGIRGRDMWWVWMKGRGFGRRCDGSRY